MSGEKFSAGTIVRFDFELSRGRREVVLLVLETTTRPGKTSARCLVLSSSATHETNTVGTWSTLDDPRWRVVA